MTDRKLTRLTDPSEIPANMTEAEAQDVWDSHVVTDACIDQSDAAGTMLDEPLRRANVASRRITLRLEADTLERLKKLAGERRMGYQTLLKNFVLNRLYEEERRRHR